MGDGRREANRARTRAAIIDAGIRLMHDQGYDATPTTQIARAAGVSPATLFNYFPTKAAIVFADDDLWTVPSPPPTPGSTPYETLRRLVHAVLDQPGWTRAADDPLTRMRFELVRREPALADEQLRRAFRQTPQLSAAVRQAHPELTEPAATALAGATIGAVLATLGWASTGDLRHDVDTALDALADPALVGRDDPATRLSTGDHPMDERTQPWTSPT